MLTVKASKLNPQLTLRDSKSIHLNNSTKTGMFVIPTSIKTNTENRVVIPMHVHAMNCDPLTPTFLPKNPEAIALNNGKIIIDKYII
jgi:hypothetical protein